MTNISSFARRGNVDWEGILRRGRRNLHRSPGRSSFAMEVAGDPRHEELGEDLSELMGVRGVDEASKVVPAGRVRNQLKDITKGNPAQNIGGGMGAVGGGLLGAGAGALAMRLAKGPGNAKWGLLAGIPAAIGGYGAGKGAVREQQVLTMLDEELGPGAGIKRAAVEEGFEVILEELLEEKKKKGTVAYPELRDTLKSLKEGRGRGLNAQERHLLGRHIPEWRNYSPENRGQPKGKPQPVNPKTPIHKPATPKSSIPKPSTPKPSSHWIGKKPLVIAGGLAALAGLGLTAAKLRPRKEEHKWLTKK